MLLGPAFSCSFITFHEGYIWNALRIPTDLIRRFIWISEFVWNTVVRVKVARLLFRKLYASLNKILEKCQI